jgi:hypothetical protein
MLGALDNIIKMTVKFSFAAFYIPPYVSSTALLHQESSQDSGTVPPVAGTVT